MPTNTVPFPPPRRLGATWPTGGHQVGASVAASLHLLLGPPVALAVFVPTVTIGLLAVGFLSIYPAALVALLGWLAVTIIVTFTLTVVALTLPLALVTAPLALIGTELGAVPLPMVLATAAARCSACSSSRSRWRRSTRWRCSRRRWPPACWASRWRTGRTGASNA